MVHHPAMKKSDPQFKFRLPEFLKKDLEAAAELNGRSVSSEIVSRLQDASDPLIPQLRDALEANRAEIIKSAQEKGWTVQQELAARLSGNGSIFTSTLELTVKNVGDLRTSDVLEFVARLESEGLDTPITAINVRVVNIAQARLPTKPTGRRLLGASARKK